MDRIKASQLLEWIVLKLRIPWYGTSILIILWLTKHYISVYFILWCAVYDW